MIYGGATVNGGKMKNVFYGIIVVGIFGLIGSFFWRDAGLPALIIMEFVAIKFGIFGKQK